MPDETKEDIVVTFSRGQIDTLMSIVAITGLAMTSKFEEHHEDPEFIYSLEHLAELGIKLQIALDVEFTS